jgi:hypothetical protein
MYLVIFPIDSGEDLYLFFHADPRPQGCKLSVREGVFLEGLEDVIEWRLDDAEPGEAEGPILAQSQRSATKYRVAPSELDIPMDWDILPNPFEVWATWEAWERSVE